MVQLVNWGYWVGGHAGVKVHVCSLLMAT
uniref:Uncharacterized protein n=1 Tax=Arundo donax TaxID=35708 RepID=A0A0A9DP23_ARUDO